MDATLVIQSHAADAKGTWIDLCTASVRDWAAQQGYGYRLLGDELFEGIPRHYRAQVGNRLPILADLGRLQAAGAALAEGYEQVVWMDADVLLWAPKRLGCVRVTDACFGREIWVQAGDSGRWRVYRSLHNAFCAFRAGSVVLPFLQRATRSIIERADAARISPQMVGPKLLSALHNIVQFEVCDAVGALSPPVLEDLHRGGGAALRRLVDEGGNDLAGANLCASLAGDADLTAVCQKLLAQGCISG